MMHARGILNACSRLSSVIYYPGVVTSISIQPSPVFSSQPNNASRDHVQAARSSEAEQGQEGLASLVEGNSQSRLMCPPHELVFTIRSSTLVSKQLPRKPGNESRRTLLRYCLSRPARSIRNQRQQSRPIRRVPSLYAGHRLICSAHLPATLQGFCPSPYRQKTRKGRQNPRRRIG